MGLLYIDIETLPVMDERKVELFDARIKPPGNIKKPESIQKWLDDESNKTEARKKTSFDGAWGSVLCIGYALDDGAVDCIYHAKEIDVLTDFKELLSNGNKTSHKMVGHYVKGFDIPFLSKRMLIHGLGPIFPFGAKPWDVNASCTGEMFSGDPRNIPSLDTLCCAFGIETPKGDLDGSMIYQAFLDGKINEIIDYCKRDVETTRSVYLKMTQAASVA